MKRNDTFELVEFKDGKLFLDNAEVKNVTGISFETKESGITEIIIKKVVRTS